MVAGGIFSRKELGFDCQVAGGAEVLCDSRGGGLDSRFGAEELRLPISGGSEVSLSVAGFSEEFSGPFQGAEVKDCRRKDGKSSVNY